MIFDLAQDFHDAVAAMPKDHPKHRMLGLLEEAVRRDVHFIDRHPGAFFQCLWNSCWWYDSPEAAQHYEVPENGWPQGEPPWEQPGPRLCTIVESWRMIKESDPDFAWLRVHTPPPIRLGTPLMGVLRGHEQSVQHLAFSPDCSRLVSADEGRVLPKKGSGASRLWDLNTLRVLASTSIPEARGRICGIKLCVI